ncbi:MAG: AarF/ABC1/UbiB kinase family protein [Phycisphaeraceae bacterium]|nr:AarF/ABC1/UbiB kinase family protein [Phycisphaeraceae bacterium]
MPSNLPSNIANLGRTIRNIRRAKEILAVLASFGFSEAIEDLQLDRLVLSGRRMVGLSKPDATVSRTPTAVRLREAMEQLGPTFVKLAQVLSTRPDLIPPEWAQEFSNLQSRVRPVPEEEIRPHIESQAQRMPGGLSLEQRFASIEYAAMAAGSIAQAHAAILADGTPVVLKVLRPGVERTIEADLEIMATLAEFIEDRYADLGYSPVQVVDQFRRQVRREVDLELERRSMARMAAAFEADQRVHFPRVYPQHSTPELLCMERIVGTLLSDFEEADFTDHQRRQIVAIGSDVVFKQCFEVGFFHADPHPGNIFVLKGEPDAKHANAISRRQDAGVRLCFIDYGMTGNIDPRTAELLADLVQGTISGDLDRVLDVVIELTGVSPMKARDRALRADAWEFISRFQSASLADLKMGALLSEFFAKIRKHKLRVPADIVYLIKAITTIEGVGEMVCPSFDLVEHVRPHVEGLLRRRYGFRAARRRVQGAVLGYAELAERAPREVAGLLHMLRSEELGVQLKHHGLQEVTNELERASRNISYALVIAALLVGGAILMLAERVSTRGAAEGPTDGFLFWAGVVAIVFAGALGVVRILTGKRLG